MEIKARNDYVPSNQLSQAATRDLQRKFGTPSIFSKMPIYENIHNRYKNSGGYSNLSSPTMKSDQSGEMLPSNGQVVNGYLQTPYHQLENEKNKVASSSNSLSKTGSEIGDGKQKRRCDLPEASVGVVGFGIVVIGAAFLIVTAVLHQDPANSIRVYLIVGIALVCIGAAFIAANWIWCSHVCLRCRGMATHSENVTIETRSDSQNTMSTDLRPLSSNGPNSQGSQEWLTLPPSQRQAGVLPHKALQPPTGQNNVNMYANYKKNNGYINDNFTYESDGTMQKKSYVSESSANTLDTAFVNENNNVVTNSKQKKGRAYRPVEYPRTSTRKDLIEQGSIDSSTEFLNPDILRQKLLRDPRLIGSGINAKNGPVPVRSQSVPDSYNDIRHQFRLSAIGDGLLYTDEVGPRFRSKSQEPPRLSHEYPSSKIPMDGLLEVAKKSYSQYIRTFGNDSETPRKQIQQNVADNLKQGYDDIKRDFYHSVDNGESRSRRSQWENSRRRRSQTNEQRRDENRNMDDNVFHTYEKDNASNFEKGETLEYNKKPSIEDQKYYMTHGFYLKKPRIDSSLQTYI